MDDFIWLTLNINIELGRIVTARLEAAAKIKLLRELGEAALDEQKFHKLSPILDKVDALRDDRNLIVHGTWGRNDIGVPIALSLKIKPLERDQVVSETFPAERMRIIAHNIDAAKLQLMILMKESRPHTNAC